MSYDESPLTPHGEIDRLGTQMVDALIEAQRLNANDMPTRSRELSLAITNLEQAIHWVQATLTFGSLRREVIVNGEKVTG